MNTVYFAGGCFWGTQHYLSQFEGVLETEVGYANGHVADPAYQQVYTDRTGHVECVRVVYDPELISLATLCRLFFKSIDPLLKNRQGDDIGTRYRTGIYWENDSDHIIVDEVYAEVQQKYELPLAVEKSRIECFYAGEEYHQKYLEKNPDGYCHLSPSLIKTAKSYSQIIKELRQYSGEVKKVAQMYEKVPYEVLEWLWETEWHQARICALLIIILKYRIAPDDAKLFSDTYLR